MPTNWTLASLLAHGEPVSGFSVRVPPRTCDVCAMQARNLGLPTSTRPAVVDAKMRRGSWANMCYRCWIQYGYCGSLGTGRGQVLLPLAPVVEFRHPLISHDLVSPEPPLDHNPCSDETADAPMSDARKAWLES